MKPIQNHRDRSVRKAAFLLLFLAVLGSGLASLLHFLDPNPQIFSLILPPINCIINLILLVCLYRNPDRLKLILWIAVTIALSSLAVAVWYFTLQATFSAEIELIETLPPITAFPIAVIACMFIFARPIQVLITSIVIWLIVALPVLTYLISHPHELFTPRGLEIALTLGPVMATLSVLILFHESIEQKMSALKSERTQMQILSEQDPLTQLCNRRGIEKLFPELILNRNSNIGVILFDIDHFKNINDQYGHSIGDTVLCKVAQRCKASLRKDDLCARWGGEEFLIIVQGAGDTALYRIAENLRMVISDLPVDPVGKVTASFGVTQFCSTDSIESLLQRVDEAMYLAKHQGRNRVVKR